MSTAIPDPANAMTLGVSANLYPGADADPLAVERLAKSYHRAAQRLVESDRDPLGSAPARLLALHAIELYLNGFLLRHGHAPADVRGLQHDFAARTDRACAAGLVLRHATAAHCKALAEGREYLVARYAPVNVPKCSALNRLIATLDEVARKTTGAAGKRVQ